MIPPPLSYMFLLPNRLIMSLKLALTTLPHLQWHYPPGNMDCFSKRKHASSTSTKLGEKENINYNTAKTKEKRMQKKNKSKYIIYLLCTQMTLRIASKIDRFCYPEKPMDLSKAFLCVWYGRGLLGGGTPIISANVTCSVTTFLHRKQTVISHRWGSGHSGQYTSPDRHWLNPYLHSSPSAVLINK